MAGEGFDVEGRLVRLCIDAATSSRESVERWRRQRRTLERMPAPLAEALLRQLIRRRLVFPSLLEVFQNCIEEVDLKGENFVDAEWMAYLGSYRYLRSLNIADCRGVTNSSLWALAGMTSLKELDLSRCSKITDAGIEHLLSLQNLTKLFIPETGVTAKAVTRLSSLRNMCALDLGGLPVTDLALNSLQELTELEYLDLWGSKISNGGAAVLKTFRNLSFLNLAWTSVTKLPTLKSLTCLNMSNCTIESVFDEEAEVKAPLSKLLLFGAKFMDAQKAFSSFELAHLTFLDLSSTALGELHFLGNMGRLEHLNLSHSGMMDSLIDSVASVGVNLRYLNLSYTKISSEGVFILAGSVPNLETLSLCHTDIDDFSLSYICLMPSLREIDLSCSKIRGFACHGNQNEEKIPSLSSLQILGHLRILNLEDTHVRDEFLYPLLFLRGLTHLYLKCDFLSDITLHALSSLPNLIFLGIQGAVLTNSGLYVFNPPATLRTLDLRQCWLLTVDAILAFSTHYPQIRVRHESTESSAVVQYPPQALSVLHGIKKTTQSKSRKDRPSNPSSSIQKNNVVVVDERIKYSREELMKLQVSR